MNNTVKAVIGKKKYELVVAETEEEKERGLQGCIELESNEGMCFRYDDDPQESLTFWMKDTPIPLDIIFVVDDVVEKVIKGEPESEDYLTCTPKKGKISYVIEVNQNSGVKEGDDVDLDGFDEEDFPELEPNKMYIIGSNGLPQAELQGGERVMSRISTRKIIKAAKKGLYQQVRQGLQEIG